MLSDGTRTGSISGGCLEADLQARANRVIQMGKAEIAVYDTTGENDLVWGVGLGCHGVATVVIEPLRGEPDWTRVLRENIAARKTTSLAVFWDKSAPQNSRTALADTTFESSAGAQIFHDDIAAPLHLLICGAGDDARPLAQLAEGLGWVATVCDPRSGHATAERFPTAQARIVCRPADLLEHVVPDAETVAVVMTHHYVHDIPLLRQLLPLDLPYVGLLGPAKRAERILSDLEGNGFEVTETMRQRLHAPVGLDIGADGAEEVALSILAEIKARLAGRKGTPLRERNGSIHGRDSA